MGRDIAIMLYQVFMWFGVHLSLMFIFSHNGGVDAWVYPLQNLHTYIAHPWHSLLHIAIAGIILWLVFNPLKHGGMGWYSKPYNLRLAFCIFVPLLLVMYWIFGQPYEVRVLWEVYPVTTLLMLPTFIKEKIVLCDGGIPIA